MIELDCDSAARCPRSCLAPKLGVIGLLVLSRLASAQENNSHVTPEPAPTEPSQEHPEFESNVIPETSLDFAQDSSRVRWSVAPYVWLVGLDGDVGIDDIDSEVDIDFVEVLTDSDTLYGFMAHVEASTPQWSLFFRTTYAHVGFDDVSESIGPIEIDVDVKADIGWLEFGGAVPLYGSQPEVLEREQPAKLRLDAYGGIRLTLIQLDLDANARFLGLPLAEENESLNEVWAEPFIGLRTQADLTDHISLALRGDIGGFGAGSELAWQARALVGFRFQVLGNPSTAFVGYSALSQDYDSGGFRWNVIAHGPVLGLKIRF